MFSNLLKILLIVCSMRSILKKNENTELLRKYSVLIEK